MRVEPTSELLEKAIVIAGFKNSLPLSIRAVTHVNGVYVQRGQMEDGSTEYAVGSDMYVPSLIFRNLPERVRVVKYLPGDWEEALNRLFLKVQKLKTSIETSDKKAFIESLQEGLDIADLDRFTRLVEADFNELFGK